MVYERKFNIAMRSTYAANYLSRMETGELTPKDLAFKKVVIDMGYSEEYSCNSNCYSHVLDHLLSPSSRFNLGREERRKSQRVSSIAMKTIDVQVKYLMNQYHVSNKSIVMRKYRQWASGVEFKTEIARLLCFSQWLCEKIDLLARMKKPQGRASEEEHINHLTSCNHARFEDIPFSFVMGDGVCMISINDKVFLCPSSYLLLIHNKVCDLVSVLLFASFGQGNLLPLEAYQTTINFMRCLIRLSIKYKEKFYDISKSLESFCVAESIIEHEEWQNREFLNVTSSDLYEATKFDYMSSDLRSLLLDADTPFRHELCCLSKLLGHPYVDMEEGTKSIHSKTTEVYTVNLLKVQESINHIKWNYVRNHIVRYSKWPPCTLSKGASPATEQAFVRGRDPYSASITKRYGQPLISDMSFIEVKANERFNKLDNIIPYLKDKTISVLRSKALKMYFDNQEEGNSDWKDTRLLLAYLLNPKLVHDHETYIERYESSEELDDLLDYLIIKIVPKELEPKVLFRGFGCKTYEDRFRALAQEKNAMRFLDRYSDEQAMTLGELEMLRRLSSFRNLWRAYVGYKIMYVVIDASSWNNHFRSETVDDVMKETLDKIFDTTIFGKTHKAYEKTFFYVPNGHEAYSWEGQGGGIEGLNQDTWVITYLGQMKVALSGLGMPYHMLCKGDDLRIAIAVPPAVWKTTELRILKNDIVKRISENMKDFGHKVKVLESYGSSVYFAFSKSASVHEIELPQGYRKVQKCYGASNALLPTLDEYIGSSFSNAHSACHTEPSVLSCYGVGLYWSLYYLVNHSCYKDISDDALVALMLTPSMVGGFPIIYLHNMAVRAESDLLSPFLGLVHYLRQQGDPAFEYMRNFCTAPLHEPGTRYTMIYKDPYALPSKRPSLPSAVLRSHITPVLQKFTRREEIKELLEASKSDAMDIIHDVLSSANVLNSKILAALYAATPEGLLDELIRKFESARSIVELLIKTLGYRKSTTMLYKVLRAEKRVQEWRKARLKGISPGREFDYSHMITACPAESAHNIRLRTWGKEVVGITMPPLQHQVYLTTAFSAGSTEWVDKNHFAYTINHPLKNINRGRSEHFSSGQYKPFLGYTTRNGMTEPTVHFIEKDPMLTKIKNLIDIITWTKVSRLRPDGSEEVSNCPELIATILKSFTTTPLEALAPFSGVRRSGTIQHHIRAPSYRESIVPNVLSNVYTRILGESNTHTRFRESKEHFHVNFLHIYCYCTWLAFIELEFSTHISTPEVMWSVTTECPFCNRPIEEQPLVFDTSRLKYVHLHPLATTKLGVVSERIMKESLDIHTAEKGTPLIVGDDTTISFDHAVIGVLQEIIDQTFTHKRQIETRYGVHFMTDEGHTILSHFQPKSKHREIGLTELKRIPNWQIVQHLSMLVEYYTTSRVHKGAYLPPVNSVQALSIRGEDLPWYGLLTQLYRCNKMARIIMEIAKFNETPTPTCFYNPAEASKYIHTNARLLAGKLQLPTTLTVLQYYSSSQLQSKIQMTQEHALKKIIDTDILRALPKKVGSAQQRVSSLSGVLVEAYRKCIVLLGCVYMSEDIAEQASQHVLETKAKEVGLVNTTDLGYLALMEMMESDEDTQGPYITSVLARFRDLGVEWDRIEEWDDEQWDDYIGYVGVHYSQKKVSILHTNIGACILRVRSETVDTDSSPEDILSKEVEQIPRHPAVPVKPRYPPPSKITLGKDFIEPYADYHLEIPLDADRVKHIPLDAFFRIHGAGTGSETTLLYLLKGLHVELDPHNRNAIGALCVADGMGGFTSVLSSVYPRSVIVFHTIPQDPSVITLPTAALTRDIDNLILSEHLDEGYYDLTTPGFYSRISKYKVPLHYTTSDLELSEGNLDQFRPIMGALLLHYIKYRVGPCVFIAKVPLFKSRDICKALDVLLEVCHYVCLVGPHTVPVYRYAYIVGAGLRHSPTDERIQHVFSQPASLDAANLYNRYVKSVSRYYSSLGKLLVQGYDLWGPSHVVGYDKAFPWFQFEPRFLSMLARSHHSVCRVITTENTDSIPDWSTIKFDVCASHNMRELESLFRVDSYKMIRDLQRYLETGIDQRASHRESVIGRIFKIKGFLALMELYRGFDQPWIITTGYLDRVFTETYDALLRRDKRGRPENHSLYEGDWFYDERRVYYASSFLEGLEGALSIGGYISYVLRHPLDKARYAEHQKRKRREVEEL